jgi:hypothetical protein
MSKSGNKEKSFWRVVFEQWVPPIITGVLGFAAGIYTTHRGDVSAERQLYLTRRVSQAEAVAINFDQYAENWRRLIQIATFEKEKGSLDEEETRRKNGFVTARNAARDKLFGALGALELYFGPKVLEKAGEFRRWDDAQTIKRLEDLPLLEEWRERELSLVSAIRQELEGQS